MYICLDLTVFGDDLEIPDEVPPLRVTPSESPAPGANQSKKEEAPSLQDEGSTEPIDKNKTGGENEDGRIKKMEQHFDHLFDDADEDKTDQNAGEVDEAEKSRETLLVPAEAKDVTQPKPKVAAGAKMKTKKSTPGVAPLALIGKANSGKQKKTRFKAKPKLPRKAAAVKK